MRSLKLDWVEFRPEMRRFYPHGELAAHVVGIDRHGRSGRCDRARQRRASKLSFDDDLAGRPGQTRVFNDVQQNAYDSVIARKPEPGANITLTIDPNLQYEAEKELDKAVAIERRARPDRSWR